ncbi:MAG: SH3 domain-containing protein [Clostridia bacterium]|nr:SH3 domain-containing protein [Clostridia bacterium]
MKCSYCGHELSDNAEFCEKCGMILGFADDKKDGSAEADAEFTQNVFQALDFDDAELDVVAMELPVSDYEETVEVSHNIPEYVSSPEDEAADYTAEPEKAFEEAEEALQNEIENLPAEDEIPTIEAEFEAPEYTPVPDVVISAKKASDAIKESNHKKEGRKKKKHNKKIYAETYDIESIPLAENEADLEAEIEKENEEAFKEAVKAPEAIAAAQVVEEVADEPLTEEIPEAAEEPVVEEIPEIIEEPVVEEIPEVIEEPVVEEIPEVIEEPVVEEIPEAIEEAVIEEESEAVEEPAEEEYVEPVEEQPAVFGLFAENGAASEEDEYYEEEEEYEDITPVEDEDTGKKKNGKGLAAAAAIFIICVVCAGAHALKDYIPVIAPTEATTDIQSTVAPSEEDTTEEETTEEETTEEESTEETTEEASTEETTEEITTEEVTTEVTTTENEVVSTTKPTTTAPTTTKPVTTTRPVTTKPVTTTRPATTKPATTKPVTTKPATTKPNTTTDPYGINDVTVKKPSSYVKSYTGYVTAEGLNMRAKPTTSSDRVLYLSKGADVKVIAKENGFLYVYSNRYGVSGWVSAAYISTSRPVETTSKLYTGTVQPDVKTAAKTMHTTYSLNIRKGPSTSYPSVQIIATGYPVKVIGSKSGVSGWVYVTDLTYGVSGWVSTAYLK